MRFAYLIEPPFSFRGRDGEVTGCDVELARYVAQQIGGSAFEPVETTFAELLPALPDGRWRMTTGLFQTDDRRRRAAFSRPIWAQGMGFCCADPILWTSPDTHRWHVNGARGLR